MRHLDLENVEEATEFERLCPGGYVVMITKATDVPEKEYLKIEYDIIEGKFANYFTNLEKTAKFWGGSFIRSYKETALPFFKGFITTVTNGNSNFHWRDNEADLIGMDIGVVLSAEEYESNDKKIKTRLYVSQVTTPEKIRRNDYSVKELKKFQSKNDGFAPPIDELPKEWL